MAGLGPGAGDARRFALCDGLPLRAPGQAAIVVPYGHVVARALGIRGPVVALAGAEASGLAAMAAAARLIREGTADVVLAGAAQALQAPLLDHLDALGMLAHGPARPFDERHAGFVPAEAAACLVLESADHARARQARPIATLVASIETFDPSVEPLALSDASEVGRGLQVALAAAGYLQGQVDLILSCADGRREGDAAQTAGIRRTFGRNAGDPALTTPAGALGFPLAAAGPLGAVIALECLRRQKVFPVAGFETPARDTELAYTRALTHERLDCVLVTAMGLGGTNGVLLLERRAVDGSGA